MRRIVAVTMLLSALTAHAELYGAVAYSYATGTWGTSWNYGDQAEAEDASARWCGQADCRAIAWVSDQCLALAVSSDGEWLGWGAHGDEDTAREEARRQCLGVSADCTVIASLCAR